MICFNIILLPMPGKLASGLENLQATNLYCICLPSIQKDRTSNKVAVLLYNTFEKGTQKKQLLTFLSLFSDIMIVISRHMDEFNIETTETPTENSLGIISYISFCSPDLLCFLP